MNIVLIKTLFTARTLLDLVRHRLSANKRLTQSEFGSLWEMRWDLCSDCISTSHCWCSWWAQTACVNPWPLRSGTCWCLRRSSHPEVMVGLLLSPTISSSVSSVLVAHFMKSFFFFFLNLFGPGSVLGQAWTWSLVAPDRVLVWLIWPTSRQQVEPNWNSRVSESESYQENYKLSLELLVMPQYKWMKSDNQK